MRPKRPGIFTQGRAARLEGADDLEEVPPHQGLTSGQDGDQRLELAADLEEPLRRRQGLGHGLPRWQCWQRALHLWVSSNEAHQGRRKT